MVVDSAIETMHEMELRLEGHLIDLRQYAARGRGLGKTPEVITGICAIENALAELSAIRNFLEDERAAMEEIATIEEQIVSREILINDVNTALNRSKGDSPLAINRSNQAEQPSSS